MSFWVAGAVIGSSVIGSMGASDAADAQAGSSAAATAEQSRQYDTTRADQAPYREAGARALGTLESENNTPLNPASVQMDPGYEFARSQGQEAIDRARAASGGRLSGAALKAASQYNTDYATTKYDTAYNRANQARSDRLNRLAALAGIGQTSTQQTGAAGQAAANAIGNIATAQGNATGAAALAQGNIWAGAGNQLASLYGRRSAGAPTGNAWSGNYGTALGQSGIGGADQLYG